MMTIADLYDLADAETDTISVAFNERDGERFDFRLTDWETGEVFGL